MDESKEITPTLVTKDLEKSFKRNIKSSWEKKRKDDKEKGATEISFLQHDDNLIEEVYDVDGGVQFAVWDGQKVEYVKQIQIHDVLYVPIFGEEITKKVVLLAECADDYEDEGKLADEIELFLKKWLGVNNGFYKIATYYILTSWVYDKFDTINYMRALGDTGTGKSRFLDCIGGLCYKFIKVSGAVTPAPIYRILQKWKGTLGIEEADLKESDETNEVIKIINCGFEKNNPIIRCDKNEPSKLDFFDAFGPKVIATRREFHDAATEARCITERMTQFDSIPDTKTALFYEKRQKLINKLLMFRFRNYYKVDVSKVLDVDLGVLEPRLRQASRSFLALVWDKPELLEDFKKFLQDYNKDIIEVRANSWMGVIVGAIAETIINNNESNLTCKWIADQIGGTYNSRNVGKGLKGLGLNIKAKKVDGTTKKLLEIDKLALSIVFKRYIVEDNILEDLARKGYPVTKVTVVTVSSLEEQNIQNDTKEQKVTELDAPPIVGNFGNSVTLETRPNPFQQFESIQPPTPSEVRQALMTQLNQANLVERQQFVSQYPAQFQMAVDILIDQMLKVGDCYEPIGGMLRKI